jgi:hypothetical protein
MMLYSLITEMKEHLEEVRQKQLKSNGKRKATQQLLRGNEVGVIEFLRMLLGCRPHPPSD